jgi:hypothetical protein
MRGRQVNADACAETFLIETKRQRKEIASRLRYENYVAELQLRNQPLGRMGPKMVTFMLGKRERGPGILQQRAHRPARSLRIVRYGSEADVTVSLREVCLVPIAEILPALA